jgi:sigma-B regulation protein RsbU (phosphoserine phosphatase)
VATVAPGDARTRALEEENRRLRRAVRELSVLNDLASAIGASLDSHHIIDTIIQRSVRALRAEQGVVMLLDRERGSDMRTLVRVGPTRESGQALHVQEAILGWMILNRRPLLLNNPRTDPRFAGVRWDDSVRSVLCAPLLTKSEVTGVLAVFNRRGVDGFGGSDQRLLSIVAAQSAQIIENARLYEEERSLRRIQEELRLAKEIQCRLLPDGSPTVPGFQVAGRSRPVEAVGGDYYDLIEAERGLTVCLGDVSGKGLSAALLMANLQATVRTHTLLTLAPADSLRNANRLLWRSTEAHKFATLFLAEVEPTSGEVTYSNAGHDPPVLISGDGSLSELSTGGLVLGFLEETPYEEGHVTMSPGDVLLIYSDGVTDALDADGRPFGRARLVSTVSRTSDRSAEAIGDAVVEAVERHAAGAEQTDDITLVVVKRLRS